MKQFPFAHTIEMTHRLQDGVLEVQDDDPQSEHRADAGGDWIPSVPSTDRLDARRVDDLGRRQDALAARPNKVPTGETEPIESCFRIRTRPLKDYDLDDVFGDLVRDARGTRDDVGQGPKSSSSTSPSAELPRVVIWAPKPAVREFICFEPMAGITDAMNLAQRGLYKELQCIPPGGASGMPSFWVKPRGF